MLYAITATVNKGRGKWTSTMQIPAFFLDSNVQGITSKEHAKFIAEEIINSCRLKTMKVNVCAVAL